MIDDLDLVCVMSVNPGFGGQGFISSSLDKIKRLKEFIQERNSQALMEVDGGIKLKNAPEVIAAGADVIVSGSGVFGQTNPTETISQMKKISV